MFFSPDCGAIVPVLAVPVCGGWRLGFGDPTVIGWVIAVCYLAAAVLCVWALFVARMGARLARRWRGPERRRRDRTKAYQASFLFWGLLCVLFLFLGVNKQVDLQTWLTEWGRDLATSQGWYEQRAQVQTVFVVVIVGGGLLTMTILLRMTRDLLPRHVPAFVGMILLGCFVASRALSFHELNDVLDWAPAGIKFRWMLEMAGIAIVGLCAAMNCWWYRLGPASEEPRLAAGPA